MHIQGDTQFWISIFIVPTDVRSNLACLRRKPQPQYMVCIMLYIHVYIIICGGMIGSYFSVNSLVAKPMYSQMAAYQLTNSRRPNRIIIITSQQTGVDPRQVVV